MARSASIERASSADARTLSEEAYEEIKRRILWNVYPGGFQVLEEVLGEELGMSRTPLKEALVRLQSEGLVELLPRRGMRVRPLEAKDIGDIYQVLSALEGLAAEAIAARADNRDAVDALQREVEHMKHALDRDDLDAWAIADERFHRVLVDASGNPRLAYAARTLLDQSQRFRTFTLRLREKPTRSTRNHEQLVAALRKHDVARAVAEHARHKAHWHTQMDEMMRRFGIRRI